MERIPSDNMTTLLQIILWVAVPWLLLMLLSSSLDLESKGLRIGPGVLIWRSDFFNKIYEKINRKAEIIDKFGNFSGDISLIIFLILPILLLINVIRFFSSFSSPLFVPNPISRINFELLLLIIIPLISALIIHELLHGVMATNRKVEVSGSGFAIIGVIIAFFVQMVPESLEQSKKKDRLAILSSAIVANLLLAILLIPVFSSSHVFVSPLYNHPTGALITDVFDGSPAFDAGIERGQVIVALQTFKEFQPPIEVRVASANSLIANLRNIPHGEVFVIITLNGNFSIIGINPPENSQLISGSYIGVSIYDYQQPKLGFLSPFLPYWMEQELSWMINMNLILGMFNLIPLPFTDGSKILSILLEEYKNENRKDKIMKGTYILSGILVVLNLLLTIF